MNLASSDLSRRSAGWLEAQRAVTVAAIAPILMGASVAPVPAAIVVFALPRNTKNMGNRVVLKI